ncbi:FG-GAP repeat domain-containing protein [Actinoplanes awajinensis]|uniref:FlgD Ig-like domain-containing protein n=1 Tax=Actinoplanes awajinensis subsp. mycoplanecinus TaxID=135947 RepID=A0A0X3V2I3_9ACTN|nr:VCBS repeat-containing protein [Actinoplanes awajinensis]KUL38989.1 hypothetical protein ADL15_10335 [Actinoplanes awajinensis subsp. mycoplanecinus]
MAVPALPAAAATPAELTVIPADITDTYATDLIGFAGQTGFLHRYTIDDSWLWTRYADRATRAVPELDGHFSSHFVPVGGDRIRMLVDVAGHTQAGALNVLDLGSGAWLHPVLPTDASLVAYLNGTMLVRAKSGPIALELRTFADDGSFSTAPVTGVPAEATSVVTVGVTPSGTTTVLGLRGVTGSASWTRYALLDYATGRLSMIPTVSGVMEVLLSDTHVGFRTSGTVQVFDRAAVVDGTAGTPAAISYPSATVVFLVGGDLLLRSTSTSRAPVRLRSADGTEREVLALSQTNPNAIVKAPNGALVVGGTGPADWAVQLVTPDGTTPIFAEAGPARTAGLTISQGLVRHIQAQNRPGETVYRYANHRLTTGTDVWTRERGGPLPDADSCETGASCVRTVDGNGYGTFYVAGTKLNSRIDGYTSHASIALGGTGGRVVDASAGWVVVNTTAPKRQLIVEPGQDRIATTRAVTGAALWFDTLWSGSAGHLQAKNLTTGVTSPAIATGAACTPDELQATGRYVYWSCGATGPAGVYDLTRKRGIGVPAAQYLLGDGYLVRHDAGGDLLRYDLTAGTIGAPEKLGSRSRDTLADDRNITWAVDKYSGNVAYTDAENAIHVVDPAVTRSAPASVIPVAGTRSDLYVDDKYGWNQPYLLNRPVTSWRATITRVGTGAVAAVVTGGAADRQIQFTWNGYLANKKAASSGLYRITLSTTADGVRNTAATTSLMVSCGTPGLHDYSCEGMPQVLAVSRAGRGAWQVASRGRTSLSNQGWTESWDIGARKNQVSALVPFGDVNRDRMNDLLVRKGNGTLYAYLGFGQAYFGQNKIVKVGTGWNRYNTLLTSGDLTGDGIADLLARDARTGTLYRYNGTGRTTFAGRAKLAGGYKSFTRIVGPGDLNGDGRADLLLVNAKGLVYTQYGTGKGTFGKVRKIGAGFAGYTAVLGVGDLNEDGRNDLLVRDKAGNLFRLLGTGKGTFAARQRIGTGYQKWAYLF